MEEKNNTPASTVPVFLRLVVLQFASLLLGALVCLLAYDRSAAVALVAGGTIHMLGGAVMALRALRVRTEKQANSVVANFFVGEVLKFALTIVMFSAALVAFQFRPGFLFAGYALTTLGYWLLLLKA